MAPFSEALIFLIQTLLHMYLLVVLIRFLLQVARADFYNPISQFVVKATNPTVKPLRRIVPGFAGLDLASLVLAFLIQMIAIWSVGFLMGYGFIDPLMAVAWGLAGTASFLINIFFFGLLISIIGSWVAPQSQNPVLTLLHQLLEPLMGPIRRIIPPMGGLDISPIFAFLLLQVLKIFLKAIPMNSSLVLGVF